jgi:hypothetical protein
MQGNDADAATIREYLVALLAALWREQEGFDSKRPFGNSSWDCGLFIPLVKAGFVSAVSDEDGCLDEIDGDAAEALIADAIKHLGATP